ncbi:hypothetical protein [Cellulosimicrobium sp. NPDC057862]|uniref:hypothetical protein n=1 Tax=Actinomycetes TaxID=1760 RepID=UPI00366CBA44
MRPSRARAVLLVLASAVVLSSCSSVVTVEEEPPATETSTDDVSIEELQTALGCTEGDDDPSTPSEHAGADVYQCTPDTSVVTFDSEGAKVLYVDSVSSAIAERGTGDRQVVGDGLWSVWGDSNDVIAAAIDLGGELTD